MPAGGFGTSLSWYQATAAPNPSSVWWRSAGARVTTAGVAGAVSSTPAFAGAGVAAGGAVLWRMHAASTTVATRTTTRRGAGPRLMARDDTAAVTAPA